MDSEYSYDLSEALAGRADDDRKRAKENQLSAPKNGARDELSPEAAIREALAFARDTAHDDERAAAIDGAVTALDALVAENRRLAEERNRERAQVAEYSQGWSNATTMMDEALRVADELRRLARCAKSQAAAPDYDEEPIRNALWALVDAALSPTTSASLLALPGSRGVAAPETHE